MRSERITVLNRNVLICAIMTGPLWFALVYIREPLLGAFVAAAGFAVAIWIQHDENKKHKVLVDKFNDMAASRQMLILEWDDDEGVEEEIEASLTDEVLEEIMFEWSGGTETDD